MQAIEALLEKAKAAGLPPILSAYTSLIKAWGACQNLVNVRRVLGDMVQDGVQPNQLHYRTAIIAHGNNYRPQEAEVLFPSPAQSQSLARGHSWPSQDLPMWACTVQCRY